MKRPTDLLLESKGSETVEWAIILGIIAFAAIALISYLGGWAKGIWQALADYGSGGG